MQVNSESNTNAIKFKTKSKVQSQLHFKRECKTEYK